MKVVLDIETVQAPREEWARLLGRQPPPGEAPPLHGDLDLFAAGAAEEQRHAEDELYAKSAFDGTFSRIVCIGLLEFSRSNGSQGIKFGTARMAPSYTARLP